MLVEGLIGITTAGKNGLTPKEYAVRSVYGAGLMIDYDTDSTGIYTTTSLIELYMYVNGNVAYYRILCIPSPNIIIKYIGINYCEFKFSGNNLYVLPKGTDIDIKYKVSLYRAAIPVFTTIPVSDFSNIVGDIITPTPD